MKFWDEVDAFKNQLRQSEGKPEYSFYDGPPFATGSPHYGHILAGTIKDVRTRFAHQTGFHVPRNFGWDTHGMPIEFEVDKMLGIKVGSARRRARAAGRCQPEPSPRWPLTPWAARAQSRADVLAMGIKAYNAKCRSIVMRCEEEWKEVVPRMGRWIDFEGGYKTMDPTYMARRPPPPPAAASRPALLAGAAPRAALRAQRSADLGCVSQESVWWVFKTLWDKGLIYRGFKVMPYSMACATPISNFEVRTATRAPAVSLTWPSPAPAEV